jgi:hypothetical protein
MADRLYLSKQGGSQEQHVCLLRTEGNHMVWNVLVTRKEACRPEAISLYIACSRSPVYISE